MDAVKTYQNTKIEALHADCQNWKSKLKFVEVEMVFINRLLDSYVFQPNTQELFDKLQSYTSNLTQMEGRKKEILILIKVHKKDLGGMLECTTESCDLTYYKKHEELKVQLVDYMEHFKSLKSDIFSYAGGILKNRKHTA